MIPRHVPSASLILALKKVISPQFIPKTSPRWINRLYLHRIPILANRRFGENKWTNVSRAATVADRDINCHFILTWTVTSIMCTYIRRPVERNESDSRSFWKSLQQPINGIYTFHMISTSLFVFLFILFFLFSTLYYSSGSRAEFDW